MSNQERLNRAVHLEDLSNLNEKEFSIEELKENISWGTRKIKFKVGNDSFLFHLVNLSEKKKYGTKTREKIDDNLELLSTATLSIRDNQVYYPSYNFKGRGRVTKKDRDQGISEKIIRKNIHRGIKKGFIYIDESGDYVHKKEIEIYNEKNEKLELVPSSLYLKETPNEVVIEDTIDINKVFDIDVRYRYVLFPVEEYGQGEESVITNLKDFIYELENNNPPTYLAFKFTYNSSYKPKDAFMLIIKENEKEYIIMNVGNKVKTKFFGMESSVGDLLEIDEDFDFDLSI